MLGFTPAKKKALKRAFEYLWQTDALRTRLFISVAVPTVSVASPRVPIAAAAVRRTMSVRIIAAMAS